MASVIDVVRDADRGVPMTVRPMKPLPPPAGDVNEQRRRSPIQAPRSKPTWEPIPLHIPAPEPPRGPAPREDQKPRGMVIINYGDDE
jgi:hypothetical protein